MALAPLVYVTDTLVFIADEGGSDTVGTSDTAVAKESSIDDAGLAMQAAKPGNDWTL